MWENRDSSTIGSQKRGTPENELLPARLKRLLEKKKRTNSVAHKLSVVLFSAPPHRGPCDVIEWRLLAPKF